MDIEQLPEKPYDENSKHTTPEQLFLREAAKHLTPRQRVIWEYHNYDKLTQDQIGKGCHISHQAVQQHIKACEQRIEKWCKEHMWVYDMLKEQMEQE